MQFITILTTAYHWTLSWTTCTQSTLWNCISCGSILILPFQIKWNKEYIELLKCQKDSWSS